METSDVVAIASAVIAASSLGLNLWLTRRKAWILTPVVDPYFVIAERPGDEDLIAMTISVLNNGYRENAVIAAGLLMGNGDVHPLELREEDEMEPIPTGKMHRIKLTRYEIRLFVQQSDAEVVGSYVQLLNRRTYYRAVYVRGLPVFTASFRDVVKLVGYSAQLFASERKRPARQAKHKAKRRELQILALGKNPPGLPKVNR